MGFVTGFDLDLTLIDSRPSIIHALATLGLEIDGVALAYPEAGIRGRIEDHFARCYPAASPTEVADRYRDIYRDQATALATELLGIEPETAPNHGGVPDRSRAASART